MTPPESFARLPASSKFLGEIMRHRILVSLCAAAGLLVSMEAFAAGNQIGVVDVQQIFASSPSVQAQKNQLEQDFKGKKAEMDAAEAQVTDLTNKYKKNASVMTQAEKQQMQMQIAQQQSKLMTMSSRFEQDSSNAQQAAMEKFLERVKTATATVAQKEGLILVVPAGSIVWSAPSLDITKDVETEFNKISS